MTNTTQVQPSDSFTPYGLTDDQFNVLQGVADTLYMLSNNQNPKGDRESIRLSNCLDMLWQQMNAVLEDDLTAKS